MANQAHWVVCVKCGRKFDESEEIAFYDEKSRRYTCWTCHLCEEQEQRKKAQLAQTRAARPVTSSKSRTVALVLCVLVGYLGIHHFYAGKTGIGVLYLFTAGLFGIGWIVDVVLIATGKYKDGKGLLISK